MKHRLIEKLDLFGYPISFNINGYNDKFKSPYGCMVSLIVYILYIMYLTNIMQSILNGSNT